MSEQTIERSPRFTRRLLYFRKWGSPSPIAWLDFGSQPFAWIVVLALTAGALTWVAR